MRFADFIAALPAQSFIDRYFGKQPVHIPAAGAGERTAGLSWARMNELLGIRSHWTEDNLKLVMNGRPVLPEFYVDEVDTPQGKAQRANPAKVDLFVSLGASLVANSVHHIAPDVAEITAMLGDQFSARAEANIYCSFEGVQAFASHCDLHEVFAVQCEGEKVWNIYDRRAPSPITAPEGEDAQAAIDEAKGAVMMKVRMRPGDLLYIPRGFYHDALASSGASLHLTISVTPYDGRILFRLLEPTALEDEAFREYLPDARANGGTELAARLAMLGERLSQIVRTQRFRDELANRQRELPESAYELALPQRRKLNFYANTQAPAEVKQTAAGAVLVTRRGSLPLGRMSEVAEWVLSRPACSLEELSANFSGFAPEELKSVIDLLERESVVQPYKPPFA
jgi:ribosomal protein L16 Arg81 hydroxylase